MCCEIVEFVFIETLFELFEILLMVSWSFLRRMMVWISYLFCGLGLERFVFDGATGFLDFDVSWWLGTRDDFIISVV